MAGHSKWNNIKNRKGAVDSKRAKVFAQVSKLIRIAVKQGGSPDPKTNASLRTVLEKARAANMPKDKIDKAIEKGMGKSASGAAIQEIRYEGYGPGGVAVMIVAHTDNTNRTSSEVKYALSRNGGNLGGPGSVQFMFSRGADGEFTCTMPMEVAEADMPQLAALLEAVQELDDVEEVYTSASNIDTEDTE